MYQKANFTVRLSQYGLTANLYLTFSILIAVGSEMDQNHLVPVVNEGFISFLVRMRARYTHGESSSTHWKGKINTAVQYLHLAFDTPDEGYVREDAHLAPSSVWYVLLGIFRTVRKCHQRLRRRCGQSEPIHPMWKSPSHPMSLYLWLSPRFSMRMLPMRCKWWWRRTRSPLLLPSFRVARNYTR